jgi:LPS export ABC transporter protein LptC
MTMFIQTGAGLMNYTKLFSWTNKSRGLKIFLLPYLLITTLIHFGSCRNDIEQIKALSNYMKLPNQSIKNWEVQYTDSAKLLGIFKAPLMNRYLNKDGDPYYEFPAGIDVVFYNKEENPESRVTAGYAIYYDKKDLWEARDSVVARNLNSNEQLNTEQLFWNLDKKQIYSEVFTKITNTDGVFFGEKGFEANQDFTKYKLKGSSGTVNVKNEDIQ